MRCKCGFNSFDHNLVCPKCHKDLTATRRLLNLEIPAPGGVNFFQIAGQRMATPQPFLGAAVGGEDFAEDLQPVEDIQPIAYSSNQPLPAEQTMSAQPLPGTPVYGAVEEIAPMPAQAFAAPMPPPQAPAQAFAAPVEEPMIEIEVTGDFGADQAGNRAQPEATFTPVNPLPAHQAAMAQIKSTLTETGDLAPEAEGEAYVLGDMAPVAPAPNRAGPEGGGGDDFSSLVGDVNLDDLEGDL